MPRFFFKVADAHAYIDAEKRRVQATGATPSPLHIMGSDASGKSGAKKYIVGTWRELWKHLDRFTRQGKGHFYEMLPPDVPLRLFFDIDAPRTDALTPDSFETSMRRVIDAARGAARKHVRAELDDAALTPVVLDATSATKFSRHIVFPNLMLRNMAHIKALAEATHAALGDDRCGLDMGVYTKERLFRVLGSAKRKPGAVALRHVDGRGFGDPVSFFGTLVSTVRESANFEAPMPLGTVYDVELDGAAPVAKRQRSALVAHNDPLIRAFETTFFANATGLRRAGDTEAQGARLVAWYMDGLRCPNKGRAHTSNLTGFRLNTKTWDAWYFCCDPECRTTEGDLIKWDRQNRRHVVDPSAFKYRHDGVPERWFKPLEALLDSEHVSAVAKAHQIRKVVYSRANKTFEVLCDVDPNPCPHGHRHTKRVYNTKLVVPKDRLHHAYWTCCGLGVHKFNVFDARPFFRA